MTGGLFWGMALDGTWENTSLPEVMRYIFFQTPGSRPASTWIQMRWAKFTSTPLVGLKDGWQRWDCCDKACSTEHVGGDICTDCFGDFGCCGWLTCSGYHEISTSFDCDGSHYKIVNMQTNNPYTASFPGTDCTHLIPHYEFTIFWTKCFGFLSFSSRIWASAPSWLHSCRPSQVFFFQVFGVLTNWQKSICVGQHKGTLYYYMIHFEKKQVILGSHEI